MKARNNACSKYTNEVTKKKIRTLLFTPSNMVLFDQGRLLISTNVIATCSTTNNLWQRLRSPVYSSGGGTRNNKKKGGRGKLSKFPLLLTSLAILAVAPAVLYYRSMSLKIRVLLLLYYDRSSMSQRKPVDGAANNIRLSRQELSQLILTYSTSTSRERHSPSRSLQHQRFMCIYGFCV